MTGILSQSLRFAVIGIAATATHLLVAIALVEAFAAPVLWANLAAFCAAVMTSYAGNHSWTFGARGRHGLYLPRFIVLALLGLALNQIIVYGMTSAAGLDYRLALAVVVLVVPTVSFLGNRLWCFAPQVLSEPISVSGPTAKTFD